MNTGREFPATIARSDSILLLIDFQSRLMPAIAAAAEVVSRAAFLAKVARRLEVPIVATEQNPRGLGPTVPELTAYARNPVEKLTFDAFSDRALLSRLPEGRQTIVVAGCETHVCVLQTVLGLLAARYRVKVAVDATGSRHDTDKQAAVSRMAAHGAELVTVEMVAFEWLEAADDPAFKAVLELIKPF